MDESKILPYIVPPAYVASEEIRADGLVRHLGHDVYSLLVHDLGGVCRNVRPEELEGTPDQAYDLAMENLVTLLRSRDIDLSLLNGPRGLPFIVAQGHWTAGACLLLSRLYEIATGQLGSPEVVACVPSRSSLVVFRLLDAAYTAEMRGIMRTAERGDAKLVSYSLFKVTPDGPAPFGPTEPPPK